MTERPATPDLSSMYEGLFEQTPVALALFDTQLRYVRVNAAMADINGVPLHEHPGRSISELLPALPEIVTQTMRDVLATGTPVHDVEVTGETPAAPGQLRSWLVSYAPVHHHGELLGLAAAAIEITELKRTEADLRASRTHLLEQADLLALANETVIVRDPNNIIVSWNDAARAMYGYTREQATGQIIHDLLRTEFPDSLAAVEHALEHTGNWQGELHHRRADGTEIFVLSRQALQRHPDGAPRAILEVNWDITDRVRYKQALSASEARYRALIESLPQIVWQLDPHGNVVYFNETWTRYTGKPSEPLTLPWRDVIHPDDLDSWLVVRSGGLQAGREYQHEIRLLGTDGEYRWHFARVRPQHHDGQLRGWIGSATDIHERKLAERTLRGLARKLEERVEERTAELREANEALEAFAYSAAHDLRTPLRAIQGLMGALLEDCEGQLDPTGLEYVQRTARAAQRMDALVQDLLTYSRLTRQHVELQPVNLDQLLRDVLETLRTHLEAEGAHVELPVKPPAVTAHPTILKQILTNLITNAVKFVPPGRPPHARITAQREDGHVRITVHDNGIGVAPEHHERIYTVFERLHGHAEYPGTGVGLAIVRKGAQRMGGETGVESERDAGSRFWLLLRAAESTQT